MEERRGKEEASSDIEQGESLEFALLTYNVNYAFARHQQGDPYSKKVLKALNEAADEAHVICLQETHQGWEYLIKNSPLLETYESRQAP